MITQRGRGDDTGWQGRGNGYWSLRGIKARDPNPNRKHSGRGSPLLFGFSDTATRAAHAITASEFTLERDTADLVRVKLLELEAERFISSLGI